MGAERPHDLVRLGATGSASAVQRRSPEQAAQGHQQIAVANIATAVKRNFVQQGRDVGRKRQIEVRPS
ncbi:N-methylhydantoinase A/oxoprolinase/acetone carboxylase beta subunit [Kitasatospora sp. MAA4]|uniref:hypothetical protein n=1 Tax=Kitasatospora sp. MAA4 TaxID=3035093 RepID=UPI0024757BEB|nr:hypothetical protein [Kitasatospora sp. MAA4]MDH6134133.1 N-methylhydantoinase A/oxoprolinase/acetone carboxylase beta subunit [Kitasatospora sp. MAA4]